MTPDQSQGPADPSDPRDRAQDPSANEVRDEIALEILRIHEESYGRGAALAETHISDDWVIVVLDQLELLPNEQFLVDKGQLDTVTHVRHQYQLAIQDTFRAAVERATGRRVIGFASTTSVGDERFMVEIFKLG